MREIPASRNPAHRGVNVRYPAEIEASALKSSIATGWMSFGVGASTRHHFSAKGLMMWSKDHVEGC
jgi:hypothetical protein